MHQWTETGQLLATDVAVMGGGPAGAVAAIAAARNGAQTLLVEQGGFLGGALTMAGTGPMMTFHAGERQVIAGIAQEVVDRLVARGASPGHIRDMTGYCSTITPFDAEALKVVLEEMALESGCRLLYHTRCVGCTTEKGWVRTGRLLTKGGTLNVTAQVFIDATADGDLSVWAGGQAHYGRDSDGLTQPMTMNAKVYNVNSARVRQFLHDHPDQGNARDSAMADASPRVALSGAYVLLAQAKANGDFSIGRETVLCFETNQPSEYIINMTRVGAASVLDPWAMTQAEIVGRRQVWETVRFLRKYIPGFEQCVLVSTGPTIGIRESRRIEGEYTLTATDLLQSRHFPDAVAMSAYPVDIHAPDGQAGTRSQHLPPGRWYGVPYRCLLVKGLTNLLVTGRCLSATHEALAAVRTTPTIMAFSQGAGTAAALACRQADGAVRAVDVTRLQTRLREQGAFLEEALPGMGTEEGR